ncbi:PREDICTED: uncharacterized protein LOC104732917 isoform X2 [Camelina sativa]|uniref:Uncharacterized protein LOC104732917 isoform X2 n=1 Tax=Camelina sativa TaxID=90675 RepID=A0ABM0V4Y7_CAMSA|nr:PREDICTED: uncharacterized protein LOC104732917 isoform X2 [Camelina sativa]
MTCVFWDVEDFPFPVGLRTDLVYQKLKSSLEKDGYVLGELSIMAYADKEKFPYDLDVYRNAGITIHLVQGDKCARVRSMLLDILSWALKQSPNCELNSEALDLMLISENIKEKTYFLQSLQNLKKLSCYNVLLLALPPHLSSSYELPTLSFDWLSASASLLDGGKPKTLPEGLDHRRKSREETVAFSDGDSDAKSMTCVFWDCFDDDDFLSGYNSCGSYNYIYHRLRCLLQADVGELSIMAYVDKNSPRLRLPPNSPIKIVRGNKDSRVHNMLVDIVLWAFNNPVVNYKTLTLMVMSEDIKEKTYLLSALEALEDRHYHVFLAVPDDYDIAASKLPSVRLSLLKSSLSHGRPLEMPFFKSREEPIKSSREEEPIAFSNIGIPNRFTTDIDVFWDVKGFPIKEEDGVFWDPILALRRKGYGGDASVRAYVDSGHGFFDMGHGLFNDSLAATIVITEGDDKFAKYTRMLLDILFWGMNNDAPAILMLMLKPPKGTRFGRVIQALKNKGFNVISASRTYDLCSSRERRRISGNQSSGSEIYLYWIADDCSNPRLFFSLIRSSLWKKGYYGGVCMTVFVDEGKFKGDLLSEYKKFLTFSVPQVTQMFVNMLCKARLFTGDSVMLIISKPFKDQKFYTVLGDMKARGYNVFLEQPDSMATFGSGMWSAHKSFIDGGGQG